MEDQQKLTEIDCASKISNNSSPQIAARGTETKDSNILLPIKKTKAKRRNILKNVNQSMETTLLPQVKLYKAKSPKSMAREISRRILEKYSPILQRKKV